MYVYVGGAVTSVEYENNRLTNCGAVTSNKNKREEEEHDGALAIRCYQCSSDQDRKGFDSCGAYKPFNRTEHIAIECNSDESYMPGSFCMKVVQQGPRGFIWDGRWRQVIRRCASVADTGVTGVCNWGVYENGVYWEECYCSSDSCNGSRNIHMHTGLCIATTFSIIILTLRRAFA